MQVFLLAISLGFIFIGNTFPATILRPLSPHPVCPHSPLTCVTVVPHILTSPPLLSKIFPWKLIDSPVSPDPPQHGLGDIDHTEPCTGYCGLGASAGSRPLVTLPQQAQSRLCLDEGQTQVLVFYRPQEQFHTLTGPGSQAHWVVLSTSRQAWGCSQWFHPGGRRPSL